MSTAWLAPLAVGAAGAIALAVTAHRLNRAVTRLRRSMLPLRVRRSRR
jgi:TRAP-type mannitol/chloroaromatic compound transport system permease large subunit